MSKNNEDNPKLCAILGPRLKAARSALHITQQQVAERAGISAEFYGRMERGNAAPSVITLRKLATALGVPMDLLCPEDTETGTDSSEDDGLSEEEIARMIRDDPELRRALAIVLKRMIWQFPRQRRLNS